MATLYYWDDWNERHIAEHGVTRAEAQCVIAHPGPGFPRSIGEEKQWVRGHSAAGRALQVIFVYRPLETVDIASLTPAERLLLDEDPEVLYVIHARDLSHNEKHQLRRRRR